jgi:hypothetical protein
MAATTGQAVPVLVPQGVLVTTVRAAVLGMAYQVGDASILFRTFPVAGTLRLHD